MTRHRLLLIAAIAALSAAGTATAGEIYKWVDDQGNIHYEDRPLGEADIKRVNIASARTDNAAVQARIEARREARAAAQQVAEEASPEMSKEELRAEQEKRAEQCQMYRQRLETFLQSQRLYEQGDGGDRRYLSEEEILAARDRVQKQIVEYCGS